MKKFNILLLLLLIVSTVGYTEPISSYITSIQLDGLSYSNSTSNIWFGLEYSTDLINSEWSDTEASGIMYWETNSTGFFEIGLSDIEIPNLFFRTRVSTNPIGDWVHFTNDIENIIITNFIDLDKISYISRFRSGTGHDYPDDYESCRSMKHYYYAYETYGGTNVNIYSPLNGSISDLTTEGHRGTRIMIKSSLHPAYQVIIFHVDINSSVTNGATVNAGDLLGTIFVHEDDTNVSTDIAVRISTIDEKETKQKMVSYFNVMNDSVFSNYLDRGVVNKSQLIISASERDLNPLFCEGQAFIGPSNSVGSIHNPLTGESIWNRWGTLTNLFIFNAY